MTDSHAGIFAPEPAQVASLVVDLFQSDNTQLAFMADQARSIAHCDASEQIAQAALALYYRTADT